MTFWHRAKRAIAAIAVLALMAGGWHGPSMMMAATASAAVECHPGMMAGGRHSDHKAMGQSHKLNADNPGKSGAVAKGGAAAKATFACPFGTIVGLETFAAQPAYAVTSTIMETRQPKPLLSIALERPDPPPRTAS